MELSNMVYIKSPEVIAAEAFSILTQLQNKCNYYEFNKTTNMTKLEIGIDQQNGNVTVIEFNTYGVDNGENIGNLLFIQYDGTDVDMDKQKTVQKNQNNQFLFAGEAYVNLIATKILVFRTSQRSI
jgi:hypothetical protein